MIKTILVTAIFVGSTAAMAAPTFQPQGPEGYQEAAIAGPTGRSKRCRVLNMAARGYTTRCYKEHLLPGTDAKARDRLFLTHPRAFRGPARNSVG